MKAKKLWIGVPCLMAVSLASLGWSPHGKGAVTIGTVAWANSLADAKARALKEGKPILHLQMFGRLDDAFC